MNQYEKGVFTPNYDTVTAIAKHLGYPVSYFYESDEELANMLLQLRKMTKLNLRRLQKKLSTTKIIT